ncbi:hypothetical protein D3C71_273460 [compost metagenome]
MFTPDTILALLDTPSSNPEPSLSPLWDKIMQISEADLPVYGYQGLQTTQKTFSALRHYQGRLIYVDSGQIQISIGTENFNIRKNKVIWVPPFMRHQVRTDGNTSTKSIFIHSFLKMFLPDTFFCFNSNPLLEELVTIASTIAIDAKLNYRMKLLAAVLVEEIDIIYKRHYAAE